VEEIHYVDHYRSGNLINQTTGEKEMLIEVYTLAECSLCNLTKRFLEGKKLSYTERVVNVDVSVNEVLELQPGNSSVPLVAIDGVVIGGWPELLDFFNKEEVAA
jgi:glutaredoxin